MGGRAIGANGIAAAAAAAAGIALYLVCRRYRAPKLVRRYPAGTSPSLLVEALREDGA